MTLLNYIGFSSGFFGMILLVLFPFWKSFLFALLVLTLIVVALVALSLPPFFEFTRDEVESHSKKQP